MRPDASWAALGSYKGPGDAAMFLRYAREFSKDRDRSQLYRVYVTDCLKGVAGARLRWADWVEPRRDFDVDEVIDSVIERAGLEVSR